MPGAGHGRDSSDELRLLPLALIDARADQPRRTARPEGLQDLVRSVAAVGVLQPIRVRQRGARYEIVAGQRRWSAARLAGLSEIPAIVVVRDDDTAFLEALIENVQREDLVLADRADAIRRVRVALGAASWESVAGALGLSRGHLHRLLAITRLPRDMRDDPRVASLNERHVRALIRLRRRAAEQHALWERIHAEALSGDQAVAAAVEALRSADEDRSRTVDATRRALGMFIREIECLEGDAVDDLRDDLRQLRARLDRVLGGGG